MAIALSTCPYIEENDLKNSLILDIVLFLVDSLNIINL